MQRELAPINRRVDARMAMGAILGTYHQAGRTGRIVWGIEFRARGGDVGTTTVSPDLASDTLDTARVRAGVARLRRAIADGSLHYHAPQEVPADRRSHALEVVRAWAAGAGPDAQRRLCGVCTPRPVAPAPRSRA